MTKRSTDTDTEDEMTREKHMIKRYKQNNQELDKEIDKELDKEIEKINILKNQIATFIYMYQQMKSTGMYNSAEIYEFEKYVHHLYEILNK